MPLYVFECGVCGRSHDDVVSFAVAQQKMCCGRVMERPPQRIARPRLATDARVVQQAAALGLPNFRSVADLDAHMETHNIRPCTADDVHYRQGVDFAHEFAKRERELREGGAGPRELAEHRMCFEDSEARRLLDLPKTIKREFGVDLDIAPADMPRAEAGYAAALAANE